MRGKSLVTEANEVPISKVCEMLGVRVLSLTRKVHCPFGHLYHSDGGISATMRIYDGSNTVFCFNCMIPYDGVSLVAKAMDCSRPEAALSILEYAGIARKSVAELWDELVNPPSETVDIDSLALALKLYCARISPNWNIIQLDSRISSILNKAFSLLDRVSTPEEAEEWLLVCKHVMLEKINEVSKTDSIR